MRAPIKPELRQALLSIRHAAVAVKAYEPQVVDALEESIRAYATTIHRAADLPAAAAAQRDRIVAQCNSVSDSIERARRYPELPMARAAVLDQVVALTRSLRDLIGILAPN